MGSGRLLVALVLAAVSPPAAAEFCADLQARYGTSILRCWDFAAAQDASINWEDTEKGAAVISTHLFDAGLTATPGATGSLRWRIKSYNQMRAEQPTIAKGWAWQKAIESGTGNWQRWFGVDELTPGKTYWIQFKTRFSPSYKTWWGGSGPKVFGFDVGCRTVNGMAVPPVCEQYTGNRFTDMGTAQSMEFGTMTTANWFAAATPNAAGRMFPSAYRGSTNYGLTWGMTPGVNSPFGTAQAEQPGPDSGGIWDGANWTGHCNSLARLDNADYVFGVAGGTAPCVGYGAPDTWHQWLIAIRSSGNFYDTNPNSPTNRTFRHDSLFKVWYDGQLLVDYDPDAAPLPNQLTQAECRAVQSPDASWNTCRSNGIDLIRDSRAVSASQGGGASWCEYACPELYPGDKGGDLTQLLLWVFSYRRGYPPGDQVWCNEELGPTDPRYNNCLALSSSGPGTGDTTGLGQWDAFLAHPQVDLYYDDVAIATVPLPLHKRPGGSRVGPGSFGLDARDVIALPPYTFTRLYPGPDKTFYNTGYGQVPLTDIYSPGGTAPSTGLPYVGAATLTSTNYLVEIPVQIGVPLGGGFIAPQYGGGKMLYFGGGHSGYRANRTNVFELASGRWTQSTYTPDMSSVIGGAVGPRQATPPGKGCATEPYRQMFAGVTGDTTTGSPVITGLSTITNLCPISGQCTGQGAVVGGYTITGAGIPAGAVIKSQDSPTQVTLTHAATATATGVTFAGGSPDCSTGGTPNNSVGGRGYWEHMDDRYAWDPRAQGWLIVQNGGTWLYNDVAQSWKRLSGPWPEGDSMMCGSGDYTRMSLRFASTLNRMLNWCATDGIFGFEYGSGPPEFTGARWVKLHQVAQENRNNNTDVTSQGAWSEFHRKFFYFTLRSAAYYGGAGWFDPMVNWFDPLAGTSCLVDTDGPCGVSGKLDSTKANFPQGRLSPRDPVTFAPDETICWTVICQQPTASLTVDNAGNLYVVGRRDNDASILIWKGIDPTGPGEAWERLETFHFDTFDNKGLRVYVGDGSPADSQNTEFSLASSAVGLFVYLPERDAYYLVMRSGSGDGGASTRGTGNPNAGGCYLNGVPDDCFRMIGLSFTGAAAPPKPPTDNHKPQVSLAPATGAIVNGTTTLTVTATDNVGVTRVELDIAGTLAKTWTAPPYTHAWNTVPVPEGPVAVAARGYDAAGNVGQTSATYTVDQPPAPDTTPPIVSITAPPPGTVSGTVNVTAIATDNVGVSKVEFFAGATLLGTDTAEPYAFAWNTTNAADGAVVLTVKATDTSNNATTSSGVAVTVSNTVIPPPTGDSIAPTLSITAPVAGASISKQTGEVQITTQATDNLGPSGLVHELKIDNVRRSLEKSAGIVYRWDIRDAALGIHLISASVNDAAGNTTTVSITVTLTE